MTLCAEVEARTPSLTATEFIRTAPSSLRENRLMDLMIAHVLENWNGRNGAGWIMVDSHKVADAIQSWRIRQGIDSDPKQCRDYVQHMFREARHVCRHADGNGCYRIHPDEVCGDACTQKYEHVAGRTVRAMSDCCFVELTTEGTCPLCS